jgi:NADH-quinone oxidoreductase subunit J
MPPLRSHADGAFASPTIGTGAAEKSAFRPALLGRLITELLIIGFLPSYSSYALRSTKVSLSQLKNRTVTSFVHSPRSVAAQSFIKVLPELLTLLAIAAPVLALVGIGLLHSGLYLIVTGSAVFTSLLVPASLLVLSVCVPLFKNPVHSLLSLIGVFINAFVMYIALRAQYLAYVFLIVYVGAVAILFLFVVMLLNVRALYSKGALITSVGQVAGILICALLSYHLVAVLSAGFYTFTPSLVAGMPKLAPFTVDALVYAVDSSSDILGFSALFEAKAAALLIIVLFILLAAMLGAIIQATKSMEVGTPNFKNLEVYTEIAAVAKGAAPLPRRLSCEILSKVSLLSR